MLSPGWIIVSAFPRRCVEPPPRVVTPRIKYYALDMRCSRSEPLAILALGFPPAYIGTAPRSDNIKGKKKFCFMP